MKLLRLLRPSVALLALAFLGAGCQEGSSEVDVQTQNVTAGAGGGIPANLDLRLPWSMQNSILHSGVRVYESTDWATDVPHTTVFREEIYNNGRGRFAVVPQAEISGTRPNWGVFRLIQEIRQGQIIRYRDLASRDSALFSANWRVIVLPTQDTIAGRLCDRYRIERLTGRFFAYTVSIDTVKGLVLRYLEEDFLGRTVSRLEYESVNYSPDFSAVVWYNESVRSGINVSVGLEGQLGFSPLEPSLLPAGYGLRQAEVAELEGDEWLKMEYTDGINTLFFLQRFPDGMRGVGGGSARGGMGLVRSEDEIMSMPIGAARALCGTIGTQRLIAVGKVPEVELLDMIQSALD